MKGRHWRPANPEEVIRRYEAGGTMAEIGKHEGVSRVTVARFIARSGSRVRDRGEHNQMAAGSTRRTKNGYVMVKTDKGTWKTRQQVEWVKVHGTVPDKCVIVRLCHNLADDKVDQVSNLVQMQMQTRCLLTTSSGKSLRLSTLPNDRNIRLLAAAAAALLVGDHLFKAGTPPGRA